MGFNSGFKGLITAAINVLETMFTKLCLNAGPSKVPISCCENRELVLR